VPFETIAPRLRLPCSKIRRGQWNASLIAFETADERWGSSAGEGGRSFTLRGSRRSYLPKGSSPQASLPAHSFGVIDPARSKVFANP
jgi:hypothetical protein